VSEVIDPQWIKAISWVSFYNTPRAPSHEVCGEWPMLELINVSKRYGPAVVLEPTRLTFEPGRTTVLIGPSGCGKTTVLRMIVGVVEPDTGEVRFDGVRLTRDNAMELRRRMGYVLQDGGLFPHLTAADNVALLARFLGWKEERIISRMGELADLVRLPGDSLQRYPAQLSGGQKQRIGIMRALMLDPAVLLLDEPLGALDPLIRYDLQQDLHEIFQRLGKTVVLVTHDMGEAGFFGHRLVLLGGGRIVQQGPLDELIRSPAEEYVTRFLNAQRVPLMGEGGRG
jgi:osmoprotectant transport system ATP-binding protein